MAQVRVRSGTEGPSHDPYGWSEVTFTRTDGLVVTYRHGGLGYERVTVNGMSIESYSEPNEVTTASRVFHRLTGMWPWDAELVPDRLEARMLRRMAPHERRQYEAFLEADARLMSYAI